MRTRSSNKQQRASLAKVDYGIDSSDEEAPGVTTKSRERNPVASSRRKRRNTSDDDRGGDDDGDDDDKIFHESDRDSDQDGNVTSEDAASVGSEIGSNFEVAGDDDTDAEVLSTGTKPARPRQGPRPAPAAAGSGAAAGSAATAVKQRLRKPPSGRKHGRASQSAIPQYKAETLNKNLRLYVGPLQRHDRYGLLLATVYGPRHQDVAIAEELRRHWPNFVLPTRGDRSRAEAGAAADASANAGSGWGGVLASPWLPVDFEEERQATLAAWLRRYRDHRPSLQRSHLLPHDSGSRLLPSSREGDLVVVMGPHTNLKQRVLRQGHGVPLSESWEVLGEDDQQDKHAGSQQPSGWLFDVGGTPLDIGWAPMSGSGSTQLLAVAAVPHSDQAYYSSESEIPNDNMKAGCIQLWALESEVDDYRVPRPCATPPRRAGTICFDWGRPKRMQWCPVPVSDDALCGLLAVLCDGKVYVVEVKKPGIDGDHATFEWIDSPIAVLGLADGFNVRATCFTWVDVNRMALGHSDGTISCWSVHPRMLLQKLAVHRTYVLDIRSGFPSQPHMVASVPVGGCPNLFDLTAASAETSSHTTPSASFQPGLLDWCEHMQGFVAGYPNSTPGATTAAFMHCRYFPQPRTIFQGFSQPACIAMGTSHPFALVGCADGTLWAFNALRKVFYMRSERVYKLKVFQHEFRPIRRLPASAGIDDDTQPRTAGDGDDGAADGRGRDMIRGAVRILWGFRAEVNDNPRNDYSRNVMKTARDKKKKQKQQLARRRGGGSRARGGSRAGGAAEGAGVVDVDRGSSDDYPEDHDPVKAIMVHEPESRIIKAAWNPNIEVGWWAAVAMGSGLIRVMDLGVDLS